MIAPTDFSLPSILDRVVSEAFPALAFVVSVRDLVAVSGCSRVLQRETQSLVLAWTLRHRLQREKVLANWSAAALLRFGVHGKTLWSDDFRVVTSQGTIIHPGAALNLFEIGIDLGFFRQPQYYCVLQPLKSTATRNIRFLACKQIDAEFYRDDDAAASLYCAALCISLLDDDTPVVALARFDLTSYSHDLAGFVTQRTSLIIASSFSHLLEKKDLSAHYTPKFGSSQWRHTLLNASNDCPRKFFRIINERLDLWSNAYLQ